MPQNFMHSMGMQDLKQMGGQTSDQLLYQKLTRLGQD